MAEKKCSFCGRPEKDVRLLLTGLNGYICDECAQQANKIILQSGVLKNDLSDENSLPDMKNVPKPKEIKAYLDEYIIGQDEAKRYL